MELSIGSDMSAATFGVEELFSWIADNPEVVKEGLSQIDGVRYMILSKSKCCHDAMHFNFVNVKEINEHENLFLLRKILAACLAEQTELGNNMQWLSDEAPELFYTDIFLHICHICDIL